MPTKVGRKRADLALSSIRSVLKEYAKAHPQAKVDSYRRDSVSVRIRIISPEFEGVTRAQREEELWSLLENLPEETVAEISLVLLFTPDEAKRSYANHEFENPLPSRLREIS